MVNYEIKVIAHSQYVNIVINNSLIDFRFIILLIQTIFTELVAAIKNEDYKYVINVMRTKISLSLLKIALVSVRGYRGRSPS